MTLRHKVLVFAVTPTGPEPQFFSTHARLEDAKRYAEIFRKLEDEGSATVTVTHEITPCDLILARYQMKSAEAARQRVLDEDARDESWRDVERRARGVGI